MITDLNDKVEQSRKDGYIVIRLEGKPFRLNTLIEFAKEVFPNHPLEHLAITEADEGEFVIAAELVIGTKPH